MSATAEELTALTLDFLSEHTTEAYIAVVLGLVWHLIWERPKWNQFSEQRQENDKTTETEAPLPTMSRETRRKTQLRGKLNLELEHVLSENEELEELVRELRLEIEHKDFILSNSHPALYHHPMDMHYPARRRAQNPGILGSAIGMTTYELDTLGSCWALLVFGYCLVTSRRQRKQKNPLSATHEQLEKVYYTTYEYADREVFPALSKIQVYLGREFQEFIDPETDMGKNIIALQSRLKTTVAWMEDMMHTQLIPLAGQVSERGVEYTQIAINFVASLELPKAEKVPTMLVSAHEETVKRLEESLEKETTEHTALKEKAQGMEMALRGKEVLLYEERMKTRAAKLEAHKVALEREETRRRETLDTREAALRSVTEEQKRLLRALLSEHVLSRQQQYRLRQIDEKNFPKKSKIVLPNPILQGFASAMYMNNISDLSSVTPSERLVQRQQQHHRFTMDCRDDSNFDEEDYYGNPSETRLLEIKEQFLRSKMTSNSLKPTQSIPSDPKGQTSTGSLLWSAANPATIAKDNIIKMQQQHQDHKQQPSSWMEDPASIMCDWRTNGNDDEARE